MAIVTERRARAAAWYAEAELSIPLLVDTDRAAARAFGVYKALGFDSVHMAIPSAFIVDHHGIVRFARLLASEVEAPQLHDYLAIADAIQGRSGTQRRPTERPRIELLHLRKGAVVDQHAERTLDASQRDVWELLLDPARYDGRVITSRWLAELAPGAIRESKERIGPTPLSLTFHDELLACAPPDRLVLRRVIVYLAIEELEIRLEPRGDDRCACRIDTKAHLFWMPAPIVELLRRLTRRRLHRWLDQLEAASRRIGL